MLRGAREVRQDDRRTGCAGHNAKTLRPIVPLLRLEVITGTTSCPHARGVNRPGFASAVPNQGCPHAGGGEPFRSRERDKAAPSRDRNAGPFLTAIIAPRAPPSNVGSAKQATRSVAAGATERGAVWMQEGDAPSCLVYYPTGSTFTESAGHMHNVFNFDKKTPAVTVEFNRSAIAT
jgi:hypothetical protein